MDETGKKLENNYRPMLILKGNKLHPLIERTLYGKTEKEPSGKIGTRLA